MRGFVVSVTSSPLGTTFINFGRKYPDQTFAGFIAAGSKIATDQRIATLQGKSSASPAQSKFGCFPAIYVIGLFHLPMIIISLRLISVNRTAVAKSTCREAFIGGQCI